MLRWLWLGVIAAVDGVCVVDVGEGPGDVDEDEAVHVQFEDVVNPYPISARHKQHDDTSTEGLSHCKTRGPSSG